MKYNLKEINELAKQKETTKLINLFKNLNWSIANKLKNIKIEIDDLIAEGNIGILKAIENYDGIGNFTTMANTYMRTEMMNFIHQNTHTVKPINYSRGGHKNISYKEVEDVFTIYDSNDDDFNHFRTQLEPYLDKLSPREKELLTELYLNDLERDDVMKKMGINQSNYYSLKNNGEMKLRKLMKPGLY